MFVATGFDTGSPCASALPSGVLPELVRYGATWSLEIDLTYSDGTPVPLGGCTVAATLYIFDQPYVVTGSVGSVLIGNAGGGVVLVTLLPNFTRNIVPVYAAAARQASAIVSVQVTDTGGNVEVYDPFPLLVLRPQDFVDVPVKNKRLLTSGLSVSPSAAAALVTAVLQSLPTTMPSTVGALWNDGGIIAIVQP